MCTSFAYGLRKQKGARSAEQIVQSSNDVQTNIRGHVSLCFDIRSIPQDRPPCKSFQNILYSPNRFFVLLALKQWCTLLFRLSSFLPWHNRPRAARKLFNVYFHFLWIAAEEGRARSGETFSIYNSLSYGLRKKKTAQRGKCFKFDIIFSSWRRNRPESVCRWNAKPRPLEKFVYLKCNCDGDGNPTKLRTIDCGVPFNFPIRKVPDSSFWPFTQH